MKKQILNKSNKFITNIYLYILLIFLFAFSFISYVAIGLVKFGFYGEYFNTFIFFSICFGLMYCIFNKRINVAIHILMFIILFISLCTDKIVPHTNDSGGGKNYFPIWARCIELLPAIIGYLLIIVFSFTIYKESQTTKLFYWTKSYEKYLFWCIVIFLLSDIFLSLMYYFFTWCDFESWNFSNFNISDMFKSCAIIPYILLITLICNKRMNVLLYTTAFIFLFIGLIFVAFHIGFSADENTTVDNFTWILRILTHVAGILGLSGIVFQHYYYKK